MSEFPFRGSIGLVGKVLQEVDDSHLDIEFFHEPKYRGAVPSAVLGDLRVLPVSFGVCSMPVGLLRNFHW